MADFAGMIETFDLQASPANLTDSLAHGAEESNRFPVSVTSPPIGGTTAGAGAIAAASGARAGVVQPMFGFNLFERIIVTPRVKDVGFVLSSTEFPVEVWNTFHDTAEILTGITITGTGGIEIVNPFGLPKTIGPKDSIVFQALMPSSGPANIGLDVLFVFAGITGTDLAVSGSRILLFSVAPDWDAGIEESISFLTDVFKAYDDTEQRRGLRSAPRRGLKFRALALEARDAGGMESLIWGWQHQPFGVPFWQDAQPLAADITAGDLTIQVNTVDRLFAAGGLAAIWQDEFTFEALTIQAVAASTITFAEPTQNDWTAGYGVKIVPVFLGRLSNAIKVSRLASFADQVDVEFQGEALQIAPAPTASPARFRGFDVLEIAPNWVSELEREYKRSTITMDPKIGPITVDDKGGTPVVSHTLPWWLDSHAKATALRAFLLARLGQLVPFWVPTWDQDLVMAIDALSGSSTITIKTVFYTRFFFPDNARRYLALIPISGAGTNRYVAVTGSVDNGDGTESLTLSAALGADVIAANTMISFLTFARLGSDETAIVWSTTEYAEAVVAIQELPKEIPA
jgi:hypothetical protein